MRSSVTSGLSACLSWLAAWWGPKMAPEIVRQYAAMRETCPQALADLARYCLMFDTTFDPQSRAQSDYNAGKRDVFLYLARVARLSGDELQSLERQTEKDYG